MKYLLATTALAGLMVLGATSAQAEYDGGEDCAECVADAVNIEQIVSGYQGAFNNIFDVDDVTNAVQEATNAANIISLDGLDMDTGDRIGDVLQSTDYSWLGQNADNDLIGRLYSELYGISQSATNVLNVFDGPIVDDIGQYAGTFQRANNTIEYGLDGYDADGLYDPDGVLLPTQSATNLANLITVDHMTGLAHQGTWADQEALNTMKFSGWSPHYDTYFGDATIYDFAQVGTNATNIFSATAIDGVDCGCVAVLQEMDGTQVVVNEISGMYHLELDLDNIVQQATNVANSISFLAPAE